MWHSWYCKMSLLTAHPVFLLIMYPSETVDFLLTLPKPSHPTEDPTLLLLHTFSPCTKELTFLILQTFSSHHNLCPATADVHFWYSTLSPHTEQCSPCDPSGAPHLSPHTTDVTFLTVLTFSSQYTLSSYYRGRNSGTVHFLVALHSLLLHSSVTGPLKALPLYFLDLHEILHAPSYLNFSQSPNFQMSPCIILSSPT